MGGRQAGRQGDETSRDGRYRKMRKKHPTSSGLEVCGGGPGPCFGIGEKGTMEWEVKRQQQDG